MVGSIDFLVVLLVLYLFDGLRVLRPRALVLDRLFGRQIVRAPILYPSEKWGWVLLNPLHPEGPIYSIEPAPYAFTPHGVLVPDLHPFDPAIKPKIDECDVTLESGVTIRTRSYADAHRLASTFEQLAVLTPEDRVPVIEALSSATFDTSQIGAIILRLRGRIVPLRRLSIALFVVAFVLLPVMIFALGLSMSILCLLPVVVALTSTSAFFYRRAVADLLPHTPKIDIYGNMVKLILYPVAAFRAVELLSFTEFSTYDPIAVVSAIGSRRDTARLAVKEMIALRYGTPSTTHQEAVEEHRHARLAAIESFVRTRKIPLADWDTPPKPQSKMCLTYCPNCNAQFKLSERPCPDCLEIQLQPLRR